MGLMIQEFYCTSAKTKHIFCCAVCECVILGEVWEGRRTDNVCVCERIHNFYLKSDLKAPVVPHYCQNGKGSEGKKAGNRYWGGG